VSKNADPGSATNASCPSAYMYGAQPLSGDLSSTVPHGNNDWRGDSVTGSYLQSLANENQGSKALSSALNSGSTTSLSFGQQLASSSEHENSNVNAMDAQQSYYRAWSAGEELHSPIPNFSPPHPSFDDRRTCEAATRILEGFY
jgi:hypothetical protein